MLTAIHFFLILDGALQQAAALIVGAL